MNLKRIICAYYDTPIEFIHMHFFQYIAEMPTGPF